MSTLALVQMSLHASKFGGPTSGSREHVHGVLVGRTDKTDDGGTNLLVTRAFPVCREVPTKPLVDTSLRLVEAHLDAIGSVDGEERIVGWYTADNDGGDAIAPDMKEGEDSTTTAPHCTSAARIVSAMASSAAQTPPPSTDPVLLVVSTRGLVGSLQGSDSGASSPLCAVYQRDAQSKSKGAYTRKIVPTISEAASAMIRDALLMDKVALQIYDFVDHVSGGFDKLDERDWLTNPAIADFVKKNS